MMPQLVTIIPALSTMAWAIYVKIKDRQFFEAATLFICAVALIINGLCVMTLFSATEISSILRFVQMLFSSAIVPLAYLYFSRQMGRQWNNTTAVFCWALMILLLIPNIVVYLGGGGSVSTSDIRPFTINFVRKGRIVAWCFTSDMIILIQAFLTALRMIPSGRTMKKYGLALSLKMKGFFIWWLSAILFIVFTSFTKFDDPSDSFMVWTYYILYSFLQCAIYSMLALRFDLHPVVTKDEGEAVHMDTFIENNKMLASKVRILMDDKKLYLKQGFTAEDAATEIGTNRTYFARMMTAEFGMKFSDMLNNYRVEHAKTLLATTSLSISDVADQSGFSDQSYMNRKFNQIVGVTPTAYRAQCH